MIKLRDYQREAVEQMKNGCILNGGVGSGKSRTALAYYYIQMGGDLDAEDYVLMYNEKIKDLYIITTARKRDTFEWDKELSIFLLSVHDEITPYKNKVVIDSWNNIKKYKDVTGAFFIFDEDRVTGNGVWVKSFLKITKSNDWIILSATPGDVWTDYIPVFIANGFFKNKTEFERMHVRYKWMANGKYPVIDSYMNVGRLMRLRRNILVDMNYVRAVERVHEDVWCQFDRDAYRELCKKRWNPWKEGPIENASDFCYCLRRLVNSDETREIRVLELFEDHPRMIIFYNFDYELEILKNLAQNNGIVCGEWNGHKHQDIPLTDKWMYLVQYNAGSEGWNCVKTDTIVFFSQNYSYKTMVQAAGRIDRLTSPFRILYYFHLKSRSGIDFGIEKALKNKKKFNERRFVDG